MIKHLEEVIRCVVSASDKKKVKDLLKKRLVALDEQLAEGQLLLTSSAGIPDATVSMCQAIMVSNIQDIRAEKIAISELLLELEEMVLDRV